MPTAYTDLRRHTWDVRLTVAGIQRIDSGDYSLIWNEAFSLLDPSKEVYSRLLTDKRLVIAMIYELVKPQIHNNTYYQTYRQQVVESLPDPSPDAVEDAIQFEWADGVDGSVLNAAVDAFWQALADFFPDQRTTILKFRDTQQKATSRVQEEMAHLIDAAGPMIDEELTSKREQITAELRASLRGTPTTASSK